MLLWKMNSFAATFKKTQEEKIPEYIVETYLTRFWVQNMVKKREEFEEYHRFFQEVRNDIFIFFQVR